jgi:hypothetical protein
MSPDYNGDEDYSSPVPYADLSNPQTLNLYGSAGNNPLTNVDPDGHDCIYFSGSGDASVKPGDCYSDTDNGIEQPHERIEPFIHPNPPASLGDQV